MTSATFSHIRKPHAGEVPPTGRRVQWPIKTLCGKHCGPMALTSADCATCPKCVAIALATSSIVGRL